jgi:hypothetical protein
MKQQSITSLPQAPDVQRRRRMIKYSVAMGIRVLCLISILFVHGWWVLIPAAGAIFLPYFAVVIANVGAGQRGQVVQRPGNIVPINQVRMPSSDDDQESTQHPEQGARGGDTV